MTQTIWNHLTHKFKYHKFKNAASFQIKEEKEFFGHNLLQGNKFEKIKKILI